MDQLLELLEKQNKLIEKQNKILLSMEKTIAYAGLISAEDDIVFSGLRIRAANALENTLSTEDTNFTVYNF